MTRISWCCLLLVGRGAWQDWSYEVEVINNRTNTTLTLSRERGTGVTVNGLLADCIYHVRVRAGSAEGSGPWSTDFTAQTLSTGTVASIRQPYHFNSVLGSFVSDITKKTIIVILFWKVILILTRSLLFQLCLALQ